MNEEINEELALCRRNDYRCEYCDGCNVCPDCGCDDCGDKFCEDCGEYERCDECDECLYCSDDRYFDKQLYLCEFEGCYKCLMGYCPCNEIIASYCSKCVPDDDKQEILEMEAEFEDAYVAYQELISPENQESREKEMMIAFEEKGVDVRWFNEVLVHKYIWDGSLNLTSLVERCCQLKFLYEYCALEDRVVEIVNNMPENHGFFAEVFDIAEDMILAELETGFPAVYPWQKELGDVLRKVFTTGTCPICFDEYESCVATPCGHCFHKDCVNVWLKANDYCPACKYDLRSDMKLR